MVGAARLCFCGRSSSGEGEPWGERVVAARGKETGRVWGRAWEEGAAAHEEEGDAAGRMRGGRAWGRRGGAALLLRAFVVGEGQCLCRVTLPLCVTQTVECVSCLVSPCWRQP